MLRLRLLSYANIKSYWVLTLPYTSHDGLSLERKQLLLERIERTNEMRLAIHDGDLIPALAEEGNKT